ncbi:serine hydrolase [Streptomyces sp. ME19-01-6]|uniref:serine hydrolase n=1 Tax=Streptomyces sp. ME19-01-6 TaxID=3028686 RepID=UPI0029A1F715|nr:serine hydrolase [Streptomyces sp. ME19-01-6]MDX3228646.1 serine hydrolase [Streptomyces sp. ME19-01-6]
MTRHRISATANWSGPARGALSLALAVGLLVAPATGAGAATATAWRPVCTSARAGLATKLSTDIATALRGRPDTVAVALRDPATDTVCTLRADRVFDSASVVKVTVLATLLWDAHEQGRQLTRRESDLATAMIIKSDNVATSALWRQLGAGKVKKFLLAAGMSRTVPGADGHWGLTQITARDQMRLLDLVTTPNTVLSDSARAYILDLMGKVVPSQRWGTPAGAPDTVRSRVKNGWLSRATHGWRVHSIGAFTGGGHSYTLTVLTQDNRTMNAGVATIEAVARAVHKDLAPA